MQRFVQTLTLSVVVSCSLLAWGDDLAAPATVTADDDGCFEYLATFTVDPGPTSLSSVDVTSSNVALQTSTITIANCQFIIFAGSNFLTLIPGCLEDETQAGLVTMTITDCAGNAFVAETVILPAGGITTEFVRGDANNDGAVGGLLDGLFILNFGFAGGAAPQCLEACDVDANGTFTALLDGLYILNFFFTSGAAIPNPYPNCGTSAIPSNLGCDLPSCP